MTNKTKTILGVGSCVAAILGAAAGILHFTKKNDEVNETELLEGEVIDVEFEEEDDTDE